MIKFPLLTILFFIGVPAFSQTQSEKEIKDLLAHKWKVTHIQEDGGQKMPIPAEWGDSFLDIKSDGTIIMIDSEKQEKGKWTYDHKTKAFTATGEVDPWKFELIKITETELTMKVTEEGGIVIMHLKRIK